MKDKKNPVTPAPVPAPVPAPPRDHAGTRLVERFEDMSPLGRLRLMQQQDGDMILAIVEDPNEPRMFGPSVEFCTCFSGGGQSPRTLKALRDLAEAMRQDNIEKPQVRGKNNITPEEW